MASVSLREIYKKYAGGVIAVSDSVSYTHLDVYKRQIIRSCLYICGDCGSA